MVKIMENPIKIHDLGVPLFLETPTCCFLHFFAALPPKTVDMAAISGAEETRHEDVIPATKLSHTSLQSCFPLNISSCWLNQPI